MKKIILLINLTCFTISVSFAQASIIPTKADSLMNVAASKLHIDTNATAEQIGQQIDNAISVMPGTHAGYLAWLKFLMKLFIPLVAVYFFVKHKLLSSDHEALKAKIASKGITLTLVAGLMLLGSCTGITHLFTSSGGSISEYVGKKGIYIQEDVAVHTAPGLNDTAQLLVIGPDTVTNALIKKAQQYISVKYPGHTSISAQQAIGTGGWYAEETIAIHSQPLLNDTAGFTFYGPDSVTNAVYNDFKTLVLSKL